MDSGLRSKLEEAVDIAASRVKNLVESYPDFFPMYTEDGKWEHGGEAWTNWCEGFLGGQLWLLYRHTGSSYWREKAEHYSRLIEDRKNDDTVHDLGFLFLPTWRRWYEETGDQELQEVLIQAGRTLSTRFQEPGGYLCSFLGPKSLFIDIMMNVPIIFYAARETGDENLWNVALQHSLTTRRYLVRGDGSTVHEGIFDTDTGQFLRESTRQGWRGDSAWARGQGWALYGFGSVYSYTGQRRFLETARQCADYYIENTPPHGVPPNDWDEPEPDQPYESSAAAIAAAGMLRLSRLVDNTAQSEGYRRYALHVLNTLTEPEFLPTETTEWEGVLKHGIYHQDKGLGVDESTMWGDYFFLDALIEALHSDSEENGE